MSLSYHFSVAVLVAGMLTGQPSGVGAWSLGGEGDGDAGWVLDNAGAKHFTIGIWGFPDYTFSRTDAEPAANDSIYPAQTAPFNTVVMQAGYQKDYMRGQGTTFMAGLTTFRWFLTEQGYHGSVPLASGPSPASTIGFERMHGIRDHIGDLRPYLSESVYPFIADSYQDEKFIHFIMDEPESGRGGWFWPPEVLGAYNEIIHEHEPDGLTYIDFGGIAGNRYFYAQRFGDVCMTGTDPDNGECNPEMMDTYAFAVDGTPLYRYEKSSLLPGRWVRKPYAGFAHLFYENVYRTALAYRGTSDIVGYNSYRPFREFPEAAGETVDALKAALGGETPVWLFFDGYGGGKPGDMSWEAYARLVTCQVYTSVIHGATGAMFYSDAMSGEAKREYWPLVRELALKLGIDREVFALPVIARYWDEAYHTDGYSHIHYSIRGADTGRVLIATNTDRELPHIVEAPDFPSLELAPLEVRVVVAGD